MPRRIKQKQRHATQSLRQRQRQSVVVNVNTAQSKRARRRRGVARRAAQQTLIHPQMRYSSEPSVYTTHVRGNAPLIHRDAIALALQAGHAEQSLRQSQPQSNPPPLPPSRQDRALAVDAVRAAMADAKVARDSIVAAQAVFRDEMAAAAERRRQFNAGGMRGVGPEIELNPDRGAAVAESAAGAAMVNPDAGFTELKPDLRAEGPPYHAEQLGPRQPDEAQARSHRDEGADEEKDEGPQQEAKSSGGFGRFRKAVGDFVGSMSPGRRPTARVVPASAERAMRHQRDIEIAFAPPDHDVPMAAISSRDLRDGSKEQRYIETLQWMQGKSAFDLKITPLTAVARGLRIKVSGGMSREEIAAAVQQVLDRKDK